MDTGRKDPRGLFKATQREDYEVSTLIPLPLHQPCVPLRPSIKPPSHRVGGEDWCRTDLQDNMACNEFCDQAGVWVSVDHGNYDLTCQGIVFYPEIPSRFSTLRLVDASRVSCFTWDGTQ